MAGNEVEIVVTSKDKSGPGISGAQEQVSRFRRAVSDTGPAAEASAGKLHKFGEQADELDTRAMGFRDTLTGVQDTMKGTAEIAQGNLFQGFFDLGAGIGDLGSGIYNFVVPALKKLSAEMLGNAVKAVRNGVVQTALAVKTKAMAAAQWLLNAAMSANPIGLVVIAIIALVAIIVIAYKRSETFRRVVQAAFRAVKDAGVGLWHGLQAAFRAIVKAGGKVLDWFRELPGKLLGFFRGLPGKLRDLGSGLINAFVDGMRAVGGAIVNALSSLIPGPIKSFLHLGSPAKEGPMSEDGGPEHWGEKVSLLFAKGMARGARGVRGTLGGMAPGPGGAGTGAGGGTVVLEIRSGGSAMDDLLVEILRKAVRSLGGNVQVALGRA